MRDNEILKWSHKMSSSVAVYFILAIRKSANKYSILEDQNKEEILEGINLEERGIVDREEMDVVEVMDNDNGMAKSVTANNLGGKDRKSLWKTLEVYKNMIKGCPWILIGDWNEIEVEDINWTGLYFTWIQSKQDPNRVILKKIDRILGNSRFMGKFPNAHAVFFTHLTSDPCPALLQIPNAFNKPKKAFRFANFIPDKPEFMKITKDQWNMPIKGCNLYELVKRTKNMKIHMKNLAWKKGNMFSRTEEWKNKLKEIQTKVDAEPHNADLRTEETNILKEYCEAVRDEEKFLFQQAKIEWLKDEDMNTKFFHAYLKSRRNRSRITMIKNEKDKIDFDKTVSHTDAEWMLRPVSNKEIKQAMFDIDDNRAPGPDGFSSKFYKKAWDIIRNDVCAAVKEFFNKGKLLGELNATVISLIPKLETPTKDFLKAAMTKFQFPSKMINLIMTCVSSASFSICVNGDRHGYFKGGRGLRQGDTISPYLQLKISHLCFADDLLVLCHGDVKSVKVVKGALNHFCNMSGLKLNMGKSTVFFGNLKDHVKQAILFVLPSKVGSLPVSYLGVPLVSKQIGINDWKKLLDKIKERVLNWKNKMLTYAGRLQLIASVLSAIYNQGDLKRGSAKVSWKVVCGSKSQGGLGLKNLGAWNEVLMTKHLCNIACNKESLWVKWVNVVRLKGRSIWGIATNTNASASWKHILSLRDKVRHHIIKKIRNGKECFMWFDKWWEKGIISEIIPIEVIQEANLNRNMKVREMIEKGEWKWPLNWRNKFNAIANTLVPHLNPNNTDSTVWITKKGVKGKFLTNKAWDDLNDRGEEVKWWKIVWFSHCIPRHAFIMWLAIQGRLSTQDRLLKWYPTNVAVCPLCEFRQRPTTKGVGLRMADSHTGMSAKNALAIQRCELSCKELDGFLSFYPIPSQYCVILTMPTQTILDAPPGYIGLYTHCFSLANLRLPLNDFFFEVLQYFKVHISRLNPFGFSKLTTFIVMCKAYDCEPSVELFRGFFNLCKAGSWLTFQKRSKKHIPSLLAKVITRIEGWHQRFFFIQDTIIPSKFPQLLLKENMLDVKSFKDKLPSGIEQNPYLHGNMANNDLQSLWAAKMSFRNFIYTEDEEDLTFLPKDFSLGFNTGSPSVSINTELVMTDEEPAVVPATEPVNERVETTADSGGVPKECKTRGGSSRPPVKRKLAFGSSTSRTIRAKASAIKDDAPMLSISDDDEGLKDYNHPYVDMLDLHDRCYARQVVIDNAVNRRSHELLKVIEKLSGEADVMKARELACEEESAEVKEHKGNVDRLMLESQKWSGYQVSLSALESKVASLEAEKANLEATEASLHQEIEEVKHDRRELVSKVIPYACMELLHSYELGRLVGKLVSSAITFGRCRTYEQVARMKDPFDLSKLNEYVADASAFVEALLLKKPPTLQKPAPSRTQMHVPSSQLATPSSNPFSKPMSPSVDIVKPSPSPNE
ncbi:RNA-directed DNA polymerase, eukaryota, reverse transcriptase zinc-binding domain protein [Tanacetum coccineum]